MRVFKNMVICKKVVSKGWYKESSCGSLLLVLMYVQIIQSSFKVDKLERASHTVNHVFLFVLFLLFVILEITYFGFWVEFCLVLIAPVPYHCIVL